MPKWKIRVASPEDAPALTAVAERTFRDAFGPDNTPEDMNLHCARYFTLEAQERELRDPAMDTLVVDDGEDGAAFLGYAQLRAAASPRGVPGVSPIELERFYVVPEQRGGGLARELMAAVLAAASERGADTIWLGVWEKNPRAIRFYGKNGFREVGDQVFVLGRDPQRDLVMCRTLILTSPWSEVRNP